MQNIEQQNLMRDLLAAVDKNRPIKTHDVIRVLTDALTQCVIAHARDRDGAESTMAGIVMLMDQQLLAADFTDPPPEYVPPSTRH
jgi:hypothetical protein